MAAFERRVQARIDTDLRCWMRSAKGPFEGRVKNLSQGGAQVEGPPDAAQVKDAITLAMELPDEPTAVHVAGEVVRLEPAGSHTHYGIRFTEVDPTHFPTLSRFISELETRAGVGSRRHPRVHHRLEVDCNTLEQFRVVMQNISRGGMGFRCEVPLVLSEKVTLLVLGGPLRNELEVPATVMHVRSVGTGVYDVGVQFDPLGEPARTLLQRFISNLLVPSSE